MIVKEAPSAKEKPMKTRTSLMRKMTRTLEPQPIASIPDKKTTYETQLPPLSLATFVWSQTDPGRLNLPEGTPKR